ncbi:flagellar basal body P-ring formation chaperone FlgA [Microvirga terricola]|nr:flagellar basal body P-ring formation chaperone FlgA [Microvirga terricola]
MLLGATGGAHAQEQMLPVPTVTIYPGDTIRQSMLKERGFPPNYRARSAVIDSSVALVGKMARRTLLPGEPIPFNAVDDPRLVTRGVATQLVFHEGGLTITAMGAPLQSGSLGEQIRVRNMDTGRIVLGTVQADGRIRIGG